MQHEVVLLGRAPSWLCVVSRDLLRVEAICTGAGRTSGWPFGLVHPRGPHRQRERPQSDDARPVELGPAHRTGEAADRLMVMAWRATCPIASPASI